jgi:hypothetical protein
MQRDSKEIKKEKEKEKEEIINDMIIPDFGPTFFLKDDELLYTLFNTKNQKFLDDITYFSYFDKVFYNSVELSLTRGGY